MTDPLARELRARLADARARADAIREGLDRRAQQAQERRTGEAGTHAHPTTDEASRTIRDAFAERGAARRARILRLVDDEETDDDR